MEPTPYDDLPGPEQALVRASWRDALARRADGLDLTAELQASGRPWSETRDDGSVWIRWLDDPS